MKVVFLIPPSETKHNSSFYQKEELCFVFEKPLFIWKNASEKDLKCTWKRYEEAIKLNHFLQGEKTVEAIKRYTWVMYSAINYAWMSLEWKKYFDKHFLILSWMYGILKPHDKIWNYKLPIETKWLIKYWKEKITSSLNELQVDYIVDLLPDSYKKMIDFKKLDSKIISIDFVKEDGKKISHFVKKIKWEWIHNICKQVRFDYKKLWKVDNNDGKIIKVKIFS